MASNRGVVACLTQSVTYAPAVNEPLPPPIRRRVALGVVAAALAILAGLAVCAFAAYETAWMQIRAERLAASQPHVSARYVDWHNFVRLKDGRKVTLWHPLMPTWNEIESGRVEVVLFPGEDRGFLVDEVPGPDYPMWARALDWASFTYDARGVVIVLLGGVYLATRLGLGFTPLALPSLLRGRVGADAVVVDWRWTGSGRALVTARMGDELVVWECRVPARATPWPGEPLRFVGHPRGGGWVLATTPTGTLHPCIPLHTPVSAAVSG